eukprot:TRINITY_DN5993_c0_g1_i2.p1 TRINITY_DN5993_c0_g1~~TRINITY_DN5993_c0_g1_i2.p1  ORF type:complete len:598 (-),score=137.40 TRINITY_DN5993_c0_g1_i2:99-1892(-)
MQPGCLFQRPQKMDRQQVPNGKPLWKAVSAIAWCAWFIIKCVSLTLFDRLYVLFSGKVDRLGGDRKELRANVAKAARNTAVKRYLETGSNNNAHNVDVLIIGGGFGGICMGFFLNLFGISHVILEQSQRVGGVWNYNTYPNAACDIPSMLYSFSFCKLPPWGWKRLHGTQKEIMEYVQYIVERFGILSNVLLKTKVNEATFVDRKDFYGWVVRADCQLFNNAPGELTFNAKFLVSSVGQLSVPKFPQTPGLTREDVSRASRNTVFHSAEWNHDVDLTGKTVAIVGNGPSGIQFTPSVIKQAKKVYLFIRSPALVIPKYDAPTTWFSRTRLFTEIFRVWTFFRAEFLSFTFDINPVSQFCNKLLMKITVQDVVSRVQNKELCNSLLPDLEHPIGCKRVVFDDGGFIDLVQRDHVKVIRSHINKFDSSTSKIYCEDGTVVGDLDTVILATGFESTNFLSTFKLTGKKGEPIQKKWGTAPIAFYGMTLPDFPNFFVLYGPGTNTGGGSILFFIECQVRYVMQAIRHAMSRSQSRPSLELKEEVYQDFIKEYRERVSNTVFTAGCASWYKTSDGTVVNNWYGIATEYWLRTHDFDASVYTV